jgi:hypothetical protein
MFSYLELSKLHKYNFQKLMTQQYIYIGKPPFFGELVSFQRTENLHVSIIRMNIEIKNAEGSVQTRDQQIKGEQCCLG